MYYYTFMCVCVPSRSGIKVSNWASTKLCTSGNTTWDPVNRYIDMIFHSNPYGVCSIHMYMYVMYRCIHVHVRRCMSFFLLCTVHVLIPSERLYSCNTPPEFLHFSRLDSQHVLCWTLTFPLPCIRPPGLFYPSSTEEGRALWPRGWHRPKKCTRFRNLWISNGISWFLNWLYTCALRASASHVATLMELYENIRR